MDMYKHGLVPTFAGEHWFMPAVAHYSLRDMGVVNQLLSTLDVAHDYVCIHEYANIAKSLLPTQFSMFFPLRKNVPPGISHLGGPSG